MTTEQKSPSLSHELGLTLAALGVVFGDIGTSPIYAMRESFHTADHQLPVTPDNVLGVLSLIFWALAISVTCKYVLFVMRADNNGEGGILALMTLATRTQGPSAKQKRIVLWMGVAGAALLLGEAMLTPAISVLSAVEGFETVYPEAHAFVLPIASVILGTLFFVQSKGTDKIGRFFGPIVAVWIACLSVFGLLETVQRPEVLASANPLYALRFLREHGFESLLVLGGVVLTITGAEALYADMGHFGAKPIRRAWLGLVFPALFFNYTGQGALLLRNPEAVSDPFFLLIPEGVRLPVILMATLVTAIASQAVISGVFSIARQASMLDLIPRLRVAHTSNEHAGQVYVPVANGILFVGALSLVLKFGSSSALASAYGIAVTATMVLSALIAALVVHYDWRKPWPLAIAMTVPFLIVDSTFLAACSMKILSGGYIPVLLALAALVCVSTWLKGRGLLRQSYAKLGLPLEDFYEVMRVEVAHRVPGQAVYLTGDATTTPRTLLQNFAHNRVVHEKVLLLTIVTDEVPFVDEENRIELTPLEDGFVRGVAHYGFSEHISVTDLITRAEIGWNPDYTTFFFGREEIAFTSNSLRPWQQKLYSHLAHSAVPAPAYFRIPLDRVLEVGVPIEI